MLAKNTPQCTFWVHEEDFWCSNDTENSNRISISVVSCQYSSPIRHSRGLLFAQSAPIWPISGIVTSKFAMHRGRIHNGIDIAAKSGTAIYAVSSGRVAFSGWRTGYGKLVIIEHDNYESWYAHCKYLHVKKGYKVRQGQKIAQVGQTGKVTGVHLHLAFKKKHGFFNPLSLLQSKRN